MGGVGFFGRANFDTFAIQTPPTGTEIAKASKALRGGDLNCRPLVPLGPALAWRDPIAPSRGPELPPHSMTRWERPSSTCGSLRPLIEKAMHAFGPFGRMKRERVCEPFQFRTGLPASRRVDHYFGEADREAGLRPELCHQGACRLDDPTVVDHFVDETVRGCLVRIEEPAGEDPLHRSPHTNVLEQLQGSSRSGNDAKAHLRKADARMWGRDAQIARQGQLPPSPERVTVERSDGGPGEIRKLEQDFLNQTV
jgi:hypothetical protein